MVMDMTVLVRVSKEEIFLEGPHSDAINCYEEHGEARSDEDASLKGQTMFLPLLWVQGRLSACSSCGSN
ncbi:hypothetical protein V6N13_037829 [Hibiscus sabdariffa]